MAVGKLLCCCNYGSSDTDPITPPQSDHGPSAAVAADAPAAAAASSSLTPLWMPPPDNTVEALDSLIKHLQSFIIDKNSKVSSSAQWKEYTDDIPRFLDELAKRQEVTMVGVGKGTFLPLLEEVLKGAGSLHWATFGFSMLAWAIHSWDKKQQNAEDCLAILKDAIFLLEHTSFMWRQRRDDETSSIGSKELMKSSLPEIAEVAFRVSAIFVSCSPDALTANKIKGCLAGLRSYVGATSLEGSIRKVKEDIAKLRQQNALIGNQQTFEKLDRMEEQGNRIEEQTKPRTTKQVSAYHTLDGEELLGRSELASQVEEHLKTDFGEGIVGVCLHGMGGVGKSTLGLHVYNNLLKQKRFAVYCRVEMQLDSKESDLPRFQEQILEAIKLSSKTNYGKIHDATHGREMLLRAFHDIRRNDTSPILLYIDNVEYWHLLLKLLPDLRKLPQGSRLLVTTRNLDTSKCIGLHPVNVKTLDGVISRQLLRQEALKNMKTMIIENHTTLTDLEEEVLGLCDGLPLALKVIGGYIAVKDATKVETWRYVVKEMKEARDVAGNEEDRLYSSLKWSIDVLNEHLRSILFDLVACELNRYFRDKAKLESIFGAEEMQNLFDRHLLILESDDEYYFHFRCHDVLASLVKRMASHPELRLFRQMVVDDDKLADVVCLMDVKVKSVQQLRQLCRMRRLRYADITMDASDFTMDGVQRFDLPDSLKALRVWANKKNRTQISLTVCSPELRLLQVFGNWDQLSSSLTKLEYLSLGHFEGSVDSYVSYLPSLRYLHLWECPDLKELPDAILRHSTNLREIRLDFCKRLERLPEDISVLTGLDFFSLAYCTSLMSIPQGIAKLTSLTTLWFYNCTGIEGLPDGMFNNLSSNLAILDLSDCEKLERLPEGISMLTTLTRLSLARCRSLKSIPQGIGKLTSLKELDFSGCSRLESLPDGMFNNLSSNLAQLHLSYCEKLERLPEGISMLTGLDFLSLAYCTSLMSIPQGIAKLTSLKELNLRSCSRLESLPDGMFNNLSSNLAQLHLCDCEKLERLLEDISMLTGLDSLSLAYCTSLMSIPQGIGKLAKLKELNLDGCITLESLPDDGMFNNLSSNLTRLDLSDCEKLERLPEDISMLTGLDFLSLAHCTSLKSIPQGIGKLTSLKTLDLRGCSTLESLPDGMFNDLSRNLAQLHLSDCEKLERLPEDISMLTGLDFLSLANCRSLKSIPQGIGKLTSLKELNLDGCITLESLPDDGMFNNLSSNLTRLDLSDCEKLERLPEDISMLTGLDFLSLANCRSLKSIPQGIGKLTSLKELDLDGCITLESLPDDGMFNNLSSNLTRLDLSDCEKLERLPEDISMLTGLDFLSLAYCTSLMSIPQGIAKLTSLKTLNLRGCNRLESLPDGMFNNLSSNLTRLDLSDCEKLERLPEGISMLTTLTRLSLAHCTSLKSIPQGIGKLTSLKKLYLNHCSSLEELPEHLWEWERSNKLWLHINGCTNLKRGL